MTINELLAILQAMSYADRANVDAVVRCMESEFDIDAVRIERFAGNENESATKVLAIRIEPEG